MILLLFNCDKDAVKMFLLLFGINRGISVASLYYKDPAKL